MLWYSKLSCCLAIPHPMYMPVHILVAPVYIYLHANVPGRATEDGPSPWVSGPKRFRWSSRFLTFAWASPGCCGHLRSKTAFGRSLSDCQRNIYFCLFVCFWLKLPTGGKRICRFRKTMIRPIHNPREQANCLASCLVCLFSERASPIPHDPARGAMNAELLLRTVGKTSAVSCAAFLPISWM